jgi:hexulose-6-phosphate isomerase
MHASPITTRREFIAVTAGTVAMAAAAAVAPSVLAQPSPAPLRKAIMYGTIGVPGSVMEKFKAVKEAGFEGVEPNGGMDQDEVLKAMDETGLVAASVC